MKNSVVIKGNKYGIIVVLDKELPFEELKEEDMLLWELPFMEEI